ncbi:MAG: hypothetical protein HYY16_07330 [Planctomycetes bacterium]|nr:hypothetical protein [Planctomycetota bacterium]
MKACRSSIRYILVAIATAAIVAHVFLIQDVRPVLYPGIDEKTSVDQLLELLRQHSISGDYERIVRAFADAHRPVSECQIFSDSSGKVVVVVGANGLWSHRDGYDAIFKGEPPADGQVFLVAGHGKSVGILGRGGRGGVCRIDSPGYFRPGGTGLGGEGGFGFLIGGDGGAGHAVGPVFGMGGRGGRGLFAGDGGAAVTIQ